MAVIGLIALKGGVGKSSICANMAAEMVNFGRTVALLDADPQESLVHWAELGEGVLSGIVESVDAEHANPFRARVEAAQRRAERVIIDCPPGFTAAATLSALLADLVIIPVGPSPLDFMSAREALELVREVRAERGGNRPVIRLVPSKVQLSTGTGRGLASSLKSLGEKVLPGICHRIAVSDSAMTGLTVTEFVPRFHPSRIEFRVLAKRVEGILK